MPCKGFKKSIQGRLNVTYGRFSLHGGACYLQCWSSLESKVWLSLCRIHNILIGKVRTPSIDSGQHTQRSKGPRAVSARTFCLPKSVSMNPSEPKDQTGTCFYSCFFSLRNSSRRLWLGTLRCLECTSYSGWEDRTASTTSQCHDLPIYVLLHNKTESIAGLMCIISRLSLVACPS